MEPRADRRLSVALVGAVVLVAVGALGYWFARQSRAQERQEAPAAQTSIVSLPVEGMSCASCVASVKRTVRALEGVTSVEVSLAERRARVRYDENKVTPDQIAAAIRELGYKTGPPVREAGK
jgi:Cu+-exporting ATPase